MNYEEILEIVRSEIKDNLRLVVDSHEEYTGGDPCCQTTHTAFLYLDDEVISEVYLG